MNNVQQVAVFNALTHKVDALRHDLSILEHTPSKEPGREVRTLSGMEKTCLRLDAEITHLTGEIEALKQSRLPVIEVLAKKHGISI